MLWSTYGKSRRLRKEKLWQTLLTEQRLKRICKRYRKLWKNIKEGKVFKKDEVVKWKCRNCGYAHEWKEAPDECPACAQSQAHYEVLCENY